MNPDPMIVNMPSAAALATRLKSRQAVHSSTLQDFQRLQKL
jgi:hypothetical protein